MNHHRASAIARATLKGRIDELVDIAKELRLKDNGTYRVFARKRLQLARELREAYRVLKGG